MNWSPCPNFGMYLHPRTLKSPFIGLKSVEFRLRMRCESGAEPGGGRSPITADATMASCGDRSH